MRDWNDVLVEAGALRSLLEESLKLIRAEQPQSEFTRLSAKNLEAAILLSEELILTISDKAGKRNG